METLSFDILFEVTKYLSPLDLIALKRINKRYNVIVDPYLWTYYLTYINLQEPGEFNEYATDENFWLIRGFPCVECWGKDFGGKGHCERHGICRLHYSGLHTSYGRFLPHDRIMKKKIRYGNHLYYCMGITCINTGSNKCVSYKCKNCCRSKLCPLHSPSFQELNVDTY